MQHCVWPTLVVQLPPVRHTVQWLPLHWSPSQHSLESRQESFSALQKQVPPEQVPQQQSPAALQGPPTAAQAHFPVEVSQLPPQQSLESAQLPPTGLQAHLPF